MEETIRKGKTDKNFDDFLFFIYEDEYMLKPIIDSEEMQEIHKCKV